MDVTRKTASKFAEFASLIPMTGHPACRGRWRNRDGGGFWVILFVFFAWKPKRGTKIPAAYYNACSTGMDGPARYGNRFRDMSYSVARRSVGACTAE